MKTAQTERGPLTRILWWVTWLSWAGFVVQQGADVERFSGTWTLMGLRCFPLVFFIWAVFRDNLRALIWYELILLFYFISAVEATFAYQADRLSVAGLSLVVTQFVSCMLYIRYRGRERRRVA